MNALFPDVFDSGKVPAIPGLSYHDDFLSIAEEDSLTAAIDAASWDTTWERRRQLYGGFYGKARQPVGEIPEWGRALGDRIGRELLDEPPLDQMLVNEYQPGQGIAMHRDYEPFDRTVVSVSLLSPCVMDFRRATDGRREAMLLSPRSVLVLSDEARYEWEHGIAQRKSDRWQGAVIPRTRRLSITFRRMKVRL